MSIAPNLSRDRIVAEALAVFRADGLAATSLRRIAERLGVKAPSIYWHVPDKRALQRLMAERIFRDCLADVPDAGDWRDWLRAFGIRLWREQHETPDIRQLIVSSPADRDASNMLRDEVVGRLERRGLARARAMEAQASVQALVTGWTTLKDRWERDGREPEPPFLRALDALIAGWDAAA